jgi:outer membrane lipoprotein-sorting protein
MKCVLVAAALSLAACSPAYAWQDYQLKRIVRNFHKVTAFEGTVVEKGIIPGGAQVKSDVVFEAPNRFAVRIAEPREWTGSTVTYDGETLVYHYPQIQYAIRFDGFDLPAGKEIDELIEYTYRRDIQSYDYHLSGGTTVAGLPTLTLWHNAKATGGWNRRGFHKVYDKYSFLLAGESQFSGGAKYAFHYERIEFNGEVDDATFTTVIPDGTVISRWDLAAPAWEEERMRAEAKFPIVLPDDNTLRLARKRIVRAAGPIPAYCIRYERGRHFALITAFASNGMSVPDYGVPIEEGRLILSPAVSSFSFVHEGTYYALLGNLPYEELIALGQEITGSQDRADRSLR